MTSTLMYTLYITDGNTINSFAIMSSATHASIAHARYSMSCLVLFQMSTPARCLD